MRVHAPAMRQPQAHQERQPGAIQTIRKYSAVGAAVGVTGVAACTVALCVFAGTSAGFDDLNEMPFMPRHNIFRMVSERTGNCFSNVGEVATIIASFAAVVGGAFGAAYGCYRAIT